MKIELNIDVEIEYEFESKYVIETPGGTEYIPSMVTISSVKSNGIELISLLSKDEIEALEEKLLVERG